MCKLSLNKSILLQIYKKYFNFAQREDKKLLQSSIKSPLHVFETHIVQLPGMKSTYSKLYYPCTVVLVVAIWVVCMIPIPETPLDDVNLIDKWTHFVMYGTLTTVIWIEYAVRHKRPSWRRLLTGGMVLPIVMGGLVEVAQATLTTCRSGDVMDALCNLLGVVLGAVVGRMAMGVIHRRRNA